MSAFLEAVLRMWRRVASIQVPHYTRSGFYLQLSIIVVFCVWSLFLPIIPTVAIGFLGVVAAVMTVRADHFSNGERAIWILICFCLFMVEMQAVYNDRDEHDKKEREQRARQDASFRALLAEGRGLFVHEERLANEEREQFTGGNGYALVLPWTLPIDDNNTLVLGITVKGKYGLSDVTVTIRQWPLPNFGTEEDFKKAISGQGPMALFVGSVDVGYLNPLPPPMRIQPAISGINEYLVNVTAKNRPTSERLRVRLNPKTKSWEYSYQVRGEVKRGPLPPIYKLLEVSKPEWIGNKVIMKYKGQ